ncbi:hypothetical protein lpari_03156 [Legionella parisiensis]|uniref:Uncharacterized protein n=1 Tax=Legionella parisiensis TaxID=45071 RepID=A0A1E5JMQ8_9GAMM|nr:hypothetical protein lpari_03156 [Legionella parisiensis]STX72353.1 Uncharacterised protein [Legionella parisiensis]
MYPIIFYYLFFYSDFTDGVIRYLAGLIADSIDDKWQALRL